MEILAQSASELEPVPAAYAPLTKSGEVPESHWLKVLTETNLLLGKSARLRIPSGKRFEIQADSGFFGTLGYSRLSIQPSVLMLEYAVPPAPNTHWVILQISGRSTYFTDNRTLEVGAGDLLLVNRHNIKRAEIEETSDFIALNNPLTSNTMDLLRNVPFPIRHSSSELTRLAIRFCQDLIPNPPWLHSDLKEDMGSIIANLLGHAFFELPTAPTANSKTKVSRHEIEAHVLSRLEDPSLSLPSIARSLGCSVRTLHRCFHQDGDMSLEAYICKARIDACSALLRQEDTQKIQLTDLALRFGFANSSHFSSAFRRVMGISPSQYRRTRDRIE